MQFYRKTRRSLGGTLGKLAIKFFIFLSLFIVVIFLISELDLPTPNKIIKQEISDDKIKVLK